MDDGFGSGVSAVGEERLQQRCRIQVGCAEGNPGNAARQKRDRKARQDKGGRRTYREPARSSAIVSTASAMRGP